MTINTEARAAFLRFALSDEALWTANFRDFGAAVLRMATLAPSHRIDRETVEEELVRLRAAWAPLAVALVGAHGAGDGGAGGHGAGGHVAGARGGDVLGGDVLGGDVLGAGAHGAGDGAKGSSAPPPLSAEAWAAIDPFDRPQLTLVLATCRQARTLSAAGRALYAVSRTKRRSTNDADRLRKYLARFGLTFEQVAEA